MKITNNSIEYLASKKRNNVKPLVSVCITTFNHERYISQCLESVLMQEADFEFEILIGEDESTDKTREICISYANRYPDKMRLFLRSSKDKIFINGSPTGRFNLLQLFKDSKGSYIAWCEGDDYWTDVNKLQIQIDGMRNFPKCSMCFHSSLIEYENDSNLNEYRTYLKTGNKVFTLSEIIRKGGGFCPTASQVYTKDIIDRIPAWFYSVPILDQFMQIHGASGGALYIDKPMSVYRKSVPGSWTNKMEQYEYALNNNLLRIQYLELYNKELDYKYKSQFRIQMNIWLRNNIKLCVENNDYLGLFKCLKLMLKVFPALSRYPFSIIYGIITLHLQKLKEI